MSNNPQEGQLTVGVESPANRKLPLGVGSTGLDDGPYLPGQTPRKNSAPKTPEELRVIRNKAWATRRATSSNEVLR